MARQRSLLLICLTVLLVGWPLSMQPSPHVWLPRADNCDPLSTPGSHCSDLIHRGDAAPAAVSVAANTTATPGITLTVTATPIATVADTPTVVATATAASTPSGTSSPRPRPRPTTIATQPPTRTVTPTPLTSPTRTPTRHSAHPGFGAIPWQSGEYYVWTVRGPSVSGLAWQLMSLNGHQWIDRSALVLRSDGMTTTFTSRLAFDATTYRFRRYDGVEDAPASVLHATLFGPYLDATSYQSWPSAACTAQVHQGVWPGLSTYGQMADLVRTTELRPGQQLVYPVYDPYGTQLVGRGSYHIIGRETLHTGLGQRATVHLRIEEGAELPIDLWYSDDPAHIVLQWSQAGQFTAVLTHYEAHSSYTGLPVATIYPRLEGGDLRCR